MRTENDYNAFLSKELRKRMDHLRFIKASDKHIGGVPDFIMWSDGTSRGFETKFINDFPKTERGKILSHVFKPKQITFLSDMQKTANYGFGGIFCKATGFLYVMSVESIPEDGNWTNGDFQALVHSGEVVLFEKSDIDGLLKYLFYLEV